MEDRILFTEKTDSNAINCDNKQYPYTGFHYPICKMLGGQNPLICVGWDAFKEDLVVCTTMHCATKMPSGKIVPKCG